MKHFHLSYGLISLCLIFTNFSMLLFGQSQLPIFVKAPLTLDSTITNQAFTPTTSNDSNKTGEEKKIYWIPAKNTEDAKRLWNQNEGIQFLNTLNISGDENSISSYVEVVSDFIGPVRLSLAGVLAKVDSQQNQTPNVEKFISSGGDAILSAVFVGPSYFNKHGNYFISLFSQRVGFEMPPLSKSISLAGAYLDTGFELKMLLLSSEKKFGLVSNLRFGFAYGGEKFYQNLSFTDQQMGAPFTYLRFQAGLSFPQQGLAILWNQIVFDQKDLKPFYTGAQLTLVITQKISP